MIDSGAGDRPKQTVEGSSDLPSKRPKIGDIVEIRIDSQFAYFQYTHKHKAYGELIRVFGGLYDTRPEDMPNLANRNVSFSAFFPLGTACSRGITHIVANSAIAEANTEFPVFKTRAVGPNKSFGPWYLWDGEREWRKDDLSEMELALPNRAAINDTMLINWIRAGHTDADYWK